MATVWGHTPNCRNRLCSVKNSETHKKGPRLYSLPNSDHACLTSLLAGSILRCQIGQQFLTARIFAQRIPVWSQLEVAVAQTDRPLFQRNQCFQCQVQLIGPGIDSP